MERHPWGRREAIGILLEPGPEFFSRRIVKSSEVLDEKLHLLCQSAFDDDVFLIQTQRKRLPVKDLLVDLVFDETTHILGSGRRASLCNPRCPELAQIVHGQHNAIG